MARALPQVRVYDAAGWWVKSVDRTRARRMAARGNGRYDARRDEVLVEAVFPDGAEREAALLARDFGVVEPRQGHARIRVWREGWAG